MTEPGKEAIEQAERLCDPHGSKMAVARALQKLRDEREHLDGVARGLADRLTSVDRANEQLVQRAEAAEKERDSVRDDAMSATAAAARESGRAEAAKRKLAELVSEVRWWNSSEGGGGYSGSLSDILDKYEAPHG